MFYVPSGHGCSVGRGVAGSPQPAAVGHGGGRLAGRGRPEAHGGPQGGGTASGSGPHAGRPTDGAAPRGLVRVEADVGAGARGRSGAAVAEVGLAAGGVRHLLVGVPHVHGLALHGQAALRLFFDLSDERKNENTNLKKIKF